MLISFAVTAKLICVFVFAYAKCWFSHDAAHIEGVQNRRLMLSFFRIFESFFVGIGYSYSVRYG